MLPTVPVPPRRIDDFVEDAGAEAVERLRRVAEPLQGARLLQVNSTAYGGGVAELLFTQVALLNDLGIETTWQLIEGAEDFFTITKFAHNGLQGGDVPWTHDMEEVYFERCRSNAAGDLNLLAGCCSSSDMVPPLRSFLRKEGLQQRGRSAG